MVTIGITLRYGEDTGNPININEQENEKNHRMKGIMLGPLVYMLRSSNHNGICDELKNVLDDKCLKFVSEEAENTLPKIINQVRKIRNKYAHLSAMTHKEYQQLYNLILSPDEKPFESRLGKILQIKQEILAHINVNFY